MAKKESNSTSHEPMCEELLMGATAAIYATNSFRVLGVSITATVSDIRRQQTRDEMQRKLGVNVDPVRHGVFALSPPPDEHQRAQAIERIGDPVLRFLDEFFWFWPTSVHPDQDVALIALARGDYVTALAEWTRLLGNAGTAAAALHNLAILHHLIAMEDRHTPARWKTAFEHWKTVVASESVWEHARNRVQQINDVRLTTGFVRRMNNTLPKAVLLISARLAVQAAEMSDVKTATSHAEIVRGATLGDGLEETVFREALKPIRDRIDAAIASARSRWKKEPRLGHTVVRDLHKDATSTLKVLDIVLPPDSAVRQGIHDEVADAILTGQIAFGQATNDWAESELLLDLASSVVAGETMRNRLQENIKAVKENAESGNDWCTTGYWDQPPHVLSDLEMARARAVAGDFDGALNILLVIDPVVGKPLRRCVAYCLSLRSIRSYNTALGEYNAETGVIKKILERIRNCDESSLYQLLGRRPTPETPSFMMPECLACGSKYYTSWVNFTFRDIPLFMCSSCSSRHDSEVASQKRKLTAECKEAAAYIQLAEEIDPKDPGIRRNSDVIKSMLKEMGAGKPDSSSIKSRLSQSRTRRIVDAVAPEADARQCFFCQIRNGSPEATILVPMHGPSTEVKLLLGTGKEYHYVVIVVPRCPECRREHEVLPSRIEAWHEAALKAAEAADLSSLLKEIEVATLAVESAVTGVKKAGNVAAFPDLTASRDRAAIACDDATAAEKRAKSEMDAAEDSVKKAQKEMGFFTKLFGRSTPALEGAHSVLKKAQTKHGKAVSSLAEALKVRESAEQAISLACNADRERAVALLNQRRASLQSAYDKQFQAKRGIVAEYKHHHRQPELPSTTRAEVTYVNHPDLRKRVSSGWRFGDKDSASSEPTAVSGLVDRSPTLRDFAPSGSKFIPMASAILCVDDTVPGYWSTEETVVLDVTSPGKDIRLKCDDTRTNVAYSTVDDKTVWVFGREVGTFDSVYSFNVEVSPNGKHFYLQAEHQGRHIVVQDGRRWGPLDEHTYAIWHTDDWSNVYATVQMKGKYHFVLDGTAGPAFDEICDAAAVVVGGGLRTAYLARSGALWHAVIDGNVQRDFDECRHLWVSKHDGTVHFWAKKGNKWFPIRTSQQGAPVDEVCAVLCGGDDGIGAVVFRTGESYVLRVGESDVPLKGRIENVVMSWHKVNGNNAVGLIVKRGDGFYICMNSIEEKIDGEVSQLVVSPDGRRFACLAKRGAATHVVVDGKTMVAMDNFKRCDIIFSADSVHVAWNVKEKTGEYSSRWHVGVDDKKLFTSVHLILCIQFHPGYSRTLAYMTVDHSSTPTRCFFTIGDQELAPCEEVCFYMCEFTDDGRLSYFASRGRTVLRVTHRLRGGATNTSK